MGVKYYTLEGLDIPALVVEGRQGKNGTTFFVKSTISVWDKAKKRSKPSHRRTIGHIDKNSPQLGFGKIIFKEDFLQENPHLRDVSVVRVRAHKYVYAEGGDTPIDLQAAAAALDLAEQKQKAAKEQAKALAQGQTIALANSTMVKHKGNHALSNTLTSTKSSTTESAAGASNSHKSTKGKDKDKHAKDSVTVSNQNRKDVDAVNFEFPVEPNIAEVEIKILDKRYKDGTYQLPDYATPLSAGMDLRAMLDKPIVIAPNATLLVRTGIAIYLNNPNLCAMILPRSGIGFWNGIVLGNLTGLIDADYQGELSVPLWNRSTESFTIKPGDRIAQIVIVPIVKTRFKVVDNFDTSIRGEGGFGSTGR